MPISERLWILHFTTFHLSNYSALIALPGFLVQLKSDVKYTWDGTVFVCQYSCFQQLTSTLLIRAICLDKVSLVLAYDSDKLHSHPHNILSPAIYHTNFTRFFEHSVEQVCYIYSNLAFCAKIWLILIYPKVSNFWNW